MAPMEPWRNSTPFFGVAAFCTTKIDDFRASFLDVDLFDDFFDQFIKEEVVEVYQLEETHNGRLN